MWTGGRDSIIETDINKNLFKFRLEAIGLTGKIVWVNKQLIKVSSKLKFWKWKIISKKIRILIEDKFHRWLNAILIIWKASISKFRPRLVMMMMLMMMMLIMLMITVNNNNKINHIKVNQEKILNQQFQFLNQIFKLKTRTWTCK